MRVNSNLILSILIIILIGVIIFISANNSDNLKTFEKRKIELLDSLRKSNNLIEKQIYENSVIRDSLYNLIKERDSSITELQTSHLRNVKELASIKGKYNSLISKPDSLTKIAINKYYEEN